MARNGKSINVKIATSKVIKALENKLAQIKKDKANQKVNEEKYSKAMGKYNKEIATLALKVINKAYRDWETDRKSTRLNSSHSAKSRMPSSA